MSGSDEVNQFSPILPVPVNDWGDVAEDVLELVEIYSLMVEALAGNNSTLDAMRAFTGRLNEIEERLDIRWDSGKPQIGGSRSPRAWEYRVC